MKILSREFAQVTVPPVLLFGLVLLVWHLAVLWFGINEFLLPPPLKVVQSLWKNLPKLLLAIQVTGSAAMTGFLLSVVVGTLTGFVFSQSKMIRSSGYPYAIFLQTVPIVAIAPLIIFWFGRGFGAVVIVAFIISVFPIIANATQGLLSIDSDLLDLFRLNNASRWQILWKLRLPCSVPAICTGAKTASGAAVVGAIVGEFYAGVSTQRPGLGYLIRLNTDQMRIDALFGAVFASTLLGIAIFVTVNFVSNRILARWFEPIVEHRV